MTIRLSVALMALCLVASPAFAQKEPAPPPAASDEAADSPEVTAQARAIADRLIERAGADGLFNNITNDRTPRVQHVRSGLLCEFDNGDADQIYLYEPGAAAPGDDVSCNTLIQRRGALITLYATRYRSGDLNSHYMAAVDEMRQRYGSMTPWSGTPASVDLPPGAPQARHARFIVTEGGQPSYTRLSIVQVGAWTVMMRFSSRPEDAQDLDGPASRVFNQAVGSVMDGSSR